MEGNIQHMVKQVSKIDVKNADDFLELFFKLCVSLLGYSKSIFEIVQGSQRPSDLDKDQATAVAEVGKMPIIKCTVSSTLRHPAQFCLS